MASILDRIPALCAALLLLTSSFACAQATPPDGKEGSLQRFVEAHSPGWNLGNTFDATGDETSWGNPLTTKQLIDNIAASGFRSIRIPITWGHRMGPAPDYTIKPEFIARTKEVIGWAVENNLYVMVNLHHDSHWIQKMPADREQVQARFDAAWKQIAPAFRDLPLTVTFEGINEPKFNDDWGKDSPEYYDLLESLNLSFHKIVRASGGNNATRPLILSTMAASNTQARLDALTQTIQKLKDPNLIATFHYYGFWPFSVNVAGSTTFDEKSRKDVIESFDRAHATFVSKGIPVIVGEYGLLGFDKNVNVIQHGEILKFFEYITFYAREKKIPLMWWDNGQHYDRRAMKWRDPLLLSVIIEGAKTRSANAETDTIFLRKGEELKDVQLSLNLNGNTLEAIRSGDKALQAGTDYSLSADRLTIPANTLRPFATGDLGLKSTLTCDFSAGANWPLNIIYYQTPELKPAEGTAKAFAIPASFNGDRLATMEAVYVAGGNAGPHNWTPFKEFAVAFNPHYYSNKIELTDRFFREVKDGQTRLTFHFWSGAELKYLITKEGPKVTGQPE